ncbi:biosynthetic arginine decarboxylase [Bacteriovoracaceae bacterium]|nr:biosynthetic arginine decarboxylase [Bacteriovoracaceae bacterium]
MSDKNWTIEKAEQTYRVKNWGDGYFGINEAGNLTVQPTSKKKSEVEIKKVVEEMKSQGVKLPAVIRFHDILRSQVKNINRIFRDTIHEADYDGKYYGVYPIKVNQMREVVEEIIDAGAPYDFGLEAGSKSELLAALVHNENPNSLTVLNGYKDEDYLRLALIGRKLNRKIIIVIEKFSELKNILRLSKEMNVTPLIGLRGKMSLQGRGKWANSCGDKAKFGLTTAEILNAVKVMEENNLMSSIVLFHYHIGSQISDIRTFKDAINEAGRIYAKLYKMGCHLEYFDAGGGLGIDYDGSRSNNDSSRNYNVKEYAQDIVYGLKQICELEGVPHPNIVTESGRAITAHHSCVITNVIDRIDRHKNNFDTSVTEGEHILVENMRTLEQESNKFTKENFQTIFNESVQIKEEGLNAFKLGVIGLDERAKIETIHWRIMEKIVSYVESTKTFVPEELKNLSVDIAPQYLCNFSVFQSAADHWAIDQILPLVPISRLNERPTTQCGIADITCDSDGKIDCFIGPDGHNETVLLHDIKEDEEYLVGLFLTGAYQDVMGDNHNLFGRVNEVHVFSDAEDPQGFYIEEIIKGNSAAQVLSTMQYNPEYMAQSLKKLINKEITRGNIAPRVGVNLVDFYEDCLANYTYLN